MSRSLMTPWENLPNLLYAGAGLVEDMPVLCPSFHDIDHSAAGAALPRRAVEQEPDMHTPLAIIAALIATVGFSLPATAQTAARSQDAAFEAARLAFETLPESDRRAIQEALIWTGDYKGAVDGGFGRGTRTAMIAYARRVGLPDEGLLETRARASLLAAANGAKAAVGFAPTTDPRSGAALALPMKILSRRIDTKTGSRWLSGDGAMALETWLLREQEANLPALFDQLKDSTANRRVTYKVLRPEFFVVSAEVGGNDQYIRFARGIVDGAPALRGYSIVYPKSQEYIAMAIANGFDPFPAPTPVQPAAPVVQAAPQPAPSSAPPRMALRATAVMVQADMAASVIGTCNNPRIGGRPARLIRKDEATGLALFEARGLSAKPIASAMASGEAGADALVVFENISGGSAAPFVSGDWLRSIAAARAARWLISRSRCTAASASVSQMPPIIASIAAWM
jgi:peptidoglycan hydrolase-like protein with peptidoglycan-binding domain